MTLFNRRLPARPADIESNPPTAMVRAEARTKTTRTDEAISTGFRRDDLGMRRRTAAAVKPAPRRPWPATVAESDEAALSPQDRARMEKCFALCRKLAKSRATDYQIEQINWRQFRSDPRVVGAGVVVAFMLAMYFGVKHGALTPPAEALRQAREMVGSMMDARDEALTAANDRNFEKHLLALGERLIAEGARNVTLTLEQLREIAAPLLGAGGSLATQHRNDSDAAVEQMLRIGANVGSSGGNIGAMITGLVTVENTWTITMASIAAFVSVSQFPQLATAALVNTTDSVGVTEQGFYKLIADDDAWQRLMDSPDDYQAAAWSIMEDLRGRFLDNRRMLNGLNVKVDAVACADNLWYLDKLIMNRPTTKMAVARWLDDEDLRDYIVEVDHDSVTFSPELQAAFEYACHGPAIDSLHPKHVGGPTYILLVGDPATGKTYAADRSVEINGLPHSETTLAPEQMGEGGPGDILTKTWNAIKQKQFKTSPLQLLGAIMRDRLLTGRNLPGHENGVLNHVTILNEAPLANPEYHRITKLFEDSSKPRWQLWTLGVSSFTGAGVFIKTTNDRLNSGTPPANVRNDRALVSRQHEVGRATRAEDATVRADIERFHEKAVFLYAEPYWQDGKWAKPKLDADDIQKVRDQFALLKDDLQRAHQDPESGFTGARVEYAMVLTKHLCFNQLKLKLFPDAAEREAKGVRVRGLDDFREMIRSHYEATKEGVL